MVSSRRVQQQPGFVLHRRPFRDTSQILDILTRDYGRIAVVARGSRSAKSKLAGVLRPFLPLSVSWTGKSDLGTLTGAEASGAPCGVTGDAVLAAYYVNELMLKLLHRHDPQGEMFDLYQRTLSALAHDQRTAVSLREFEMEFLDLLGYALVLDREAGSQVPLQADSFYEYRVEQGPVPVERRSGPMVFSGAALTATAARQFDDPAVLQSASRLLRDVIAWHLDGRMLQSRKVLREIHRGRIRPVTATENGSKLD